MTQLILSNSDVGTHACNITMKAESAITTKYLLGKFGTNSGQINICGDSDLPIGVITDECAVGDVVNVALLGSPDTLKAVAGGVISAGSIIVPDASGKVRALPAADQSDATYNMIGVALTAAGADGVVIEFMSCVPQQQVVEAA